MWLTMLPIKPSHAVCKQSKQGTCQTFGQWAVVHGPILGIRYQLLLYWHKHLQPRLENAPQDVGAR